MKRIINGFDLQGMLTNALNNIRNAEKTINSMNVFPVADGDTGTNMRLTLENGLARAKRNKHLGLYLKEVARGMLLGARGNSGVILSQLFKGMSVELLSKGIVNPREMKIAFIRGYNTAYKAVVNPVEGTILTVSREGIENIKDKIVGNISLNDTLKMYLIEMNASLKRTPDLLPTLKEASVLDSGAYGYIKIIEGMYKYLEGEKITSDTPVEELVVLDKPNYFGEDSEFVEGYCTEFLLQLLTSREFLDLNKFISYLKEMGNSIVCLQEGSIVKVHIHTLNPAPVIELARKYGEFISFKLENMQLQHNEFAIVKKKDSTLKKELGIIAVVNGNELENKYREMGADIVISSSGNMNTSTNEFVVAINSINAKKIVIFPNNPNTIGAAKQAIELTKTTAIATVIPSRSMMEGYMALQMDIPDDDANSRINEFKENIHSVLTVSSTTASKNYNRSNFSCSIGDKIGLINDELVSSSKSIIDSFILALEKVEDISDKAGLLIFLGKDFSEEAADKLDELISDKFSHLEYQINKGEQDIYDILAGLF